ncbi:MAG: hypothetical protein HS107_07940 [Thermoflexaceae bacterium]|nr:hypothetical protein [Thermoflexaceae bacterium]
MVRMRRRAKPPGVQLGVALLGLVALSAGYLALMRATLDYSRLEEGTTASDRDEIYLVLHTGMLVLALITGFAAGKWLNGMGAAYATLFAVFLAVFMVTAQVGSYELACGGQNDLIRHWAC